MKTVYICGDSFGSTDSDYPGVSWSEHLAKELPDYKIVNLSIVAASNLLINLQVERAINNGADFIIALATTITRYELKLNKPGQHSELFDRFFSFSGNNEDKDLMSYSFLTIENYPVDTDTQQYIKNFHTQFFDFELDLFKNKCIIENTLQKLTDSNIPFLFDQGGFEHSSFEGSKTGYFKKYKKNISKINLWDYAQGPKQLKPYFHILDQDINQRVAKYYAEQIRSAT